MDGRLLAPLMLHQRHTLHRGLRAWLPHALKGRRLLRVWVGLQPLLHLLPVCGLLFGQARRSRCHVLRHRLLHRLSPCMHGPGLLLRRMLSHCGCTASRCLCIRCCRGDGRSPHLVACGGASSLHCVPARLCLRVVMLCSCDRWRGAVESV